MNPNKTPDGQDMLLSQEAEMLGRHLVENYGETTHRVSQLVHMLMRNDPNKTCIHAVSMFTLFRLLFDNAGLNAVEQWGQEMEQMCLEQFPFRPDTAPAPQEAAAVRSVNPVLAARQGAQQPQEAPVASIPDSGIPDGPTGPYAQEDAPPQVSTTAPVKSVEDAIAKARETKAKSGPDKGVQPWGVGMPTITGRDDS